MSLVETRIVARRDWAQGLMSLTLDHVLESFTPGQFINLSLSIEGAPVKRAYSVASAAGCPCELLVSQVSDGVFTPALFRLGVGESVGIDPQPAGFFTLQWLPDTATELWMISTGTGLGPFLSMLRTPGLLTKYERVVLVHGVRSLQHLTYRDELEQRAGDQLTYLPLASRDAPSAGVLSGRSPALIENGQLEEAANLRLDADKSHVLLCGNPAMISDAKAALGAKGLRMHRQRKPGHITTEKYW